MQIRSSDVCILNDPELKASTASYATDQIFRELKLVCCADTLSLEGFLWQTICHCVSSVPAQMAWLVLLRTSRATHKVDTTADCDRTGSGKSGQQLQSAKQLRLTWLNKGSSW